MTRQKSDEVLLEPISIDMIIRDFEKLKDPGRQNLFKQGYRDFMDGLQKPSEKVPNGLLTLWHDGWSFRWHEINNTPMSGLEVSYLTAFTQDLREKAQATDVVIDFTQYEDNDIPIKEKYDLEKDVSILSALQSRQVLTIQYTDGRPPAKILMDRIGIVHNLDRLLKSVISQHGSGQADKIKQMMRDNGPAFGSEKCNPPGQPFPGEGTIVLSKLESMEVKRLAQQILDIFSNAGI